MNNKIKPIITQLESLFEGVTSEFRDEVTVSLGPDRIVEVCRHLKEQAGFEMLLDITAVDYCPDLETRFHLIYHFYSFKRNIILVLRIPLEGNDPEIHTIEGIYPNANWYEREIWDLMGIRFTGHSDLRRIMLPQDWVGHPLRKDYPLGYEEVQFTFNIDDINKKKSYPKA